MKRRYEELKLRISKAQPSQQKTPTSPRQADSATQEKMGQPSPNDADSAARDERQEEHRPDPQAEAQQDGSPDEPRKPARRQEAYDDDDLEAGEGEQDAPTEVINLNTDDRSQLDPLAWKMLRQLKNIKQRMSALEAEYPDGEPDDLDEYEPDAALTDQA